MNIFDNNSDVEGNRAEIEPSLRNLLIEENSEGADRRLTCPYITCQQNT